MRRARSLLPWLGIGLLLPLWLLAQDAIREPFGIRLDVVGPIGPATSDYLHRGMESAAREGAEIIILRMDTPGGLDLSMRDIIQEVLNSPVPVITYVAPDGARAASAGTYILYASHVAAMAPATNLGAATPVDLGGENPLPGPAGSDEPESGDKKTPEPPLGDAMRHKVVNDAVAYIRGLAALRGRNAEWAEKAVREAASLEAPEALKLRVIDIVAIDMKDLLVQLDGRKVNLPGGERTLRTRNLNIVDVEPDWRSRLLAVITNPNVAYLLMIVGIWGLILEFSNPGTVVAGVVGSICLLLALFAFQTLPINYAGVALILLGISLMVGEAFAPSFGALGIGGVIAFAMGSVLLIDTEAPGFGLSRGLIGAVALFSALLFIGVLHLAFKARRRPVVTGTEELVGAVAIAADDFTGRGPVRIHSELWQAESSTPVRKGERVRVTRMKGLLLHVAPETTPRGE